MKRLLPVGGVPLALPSQPEGDNQAMHDQSRLPSEAQLIVHADKFPGHEYAPRSRIKSGRLFVECSTCVQERSRAYRRRHSGRDETVVPVLKDRIGDKTRVSTASVNGLTVGQIVDACKGYHPDDRLEVFVQPRRREHGYRILNATIIPSISIKL